MAGMGAYLIPSNLKYGPRLFSWFRTVLSWFRLQVGVRGSYYVGDPRIFLD